ncbi:MAG: VanZ family protein [Methylobacter sp.]|nr:VanZ family protein [Methylobacter sp.]
MRLLSIYFIALGFLSLNPWLRPDPHLAVGVVGWDLVDHAIAYGLLSILLLSTFVKQRRQLSMTLMGVLVCSLIGVMFEYSQYWFTSTRQFSFYDAIANIFGSVLGVAAFWGVKLWLFANAERAK